MDRKSIDNPNEENALIIYICFSDSIGFLSGSCKSHDFYQVP